MKSLITTWNLENEQHRRPFSRLKKNFNRLMPTRNFNMMQFNILYLTCNQIGGLLLKNVIAYIKMSNKIFCWTHKPQLHYSRRHLDELVLRPVNVFEWSGWNQYIHLNVKTFPNSFPNPPFEVINETNKITIISISECDFMTNFKFLALAHWELSWNQLVWILRFKKNLNILAK